MHPSSSVKQELGASFSNRLSSCELELLEASQSHSCCIITFHNHVISDCGVI